MPRDFAADPRPLRERYEETGDVRYAEVAIGDCPDAPPAWALDAIPEVDLIGAIEFAAAYRRDPERFDDGTRRGPKAQHTHLDGIGLDRIEQLVLSGDQRVFKKNGKINVKAAAQIVAEEQVPIRDDDSHEDTDRKLAQREAIIHRLEKHWSHETRGIIQSAYVQTNYRIRGSALHRLRHQVKRSRRTD
jgi:hypothetical protein